MTLRLSSAAGTRLVMWLAGVGAAVFPATGLGQVRIIRGAMVGAPGPAAAAEPQQGVYVRDSATATDKFELGRRMERLKEWHKSADVYQEILEKYQDRVIPVATDPKGRFVKYSSVTVAVQERLARWPDEGLAVYRARYEPSAAMMLDQCRFGDYRLLHDILSRYFVTESAKQAGMRLMGLYLESGEFMAATWIGQRLLQWHPNLGADRPRVLFQTAVALHLAGQATEATRMLEELKSKHANEVATIAGRDTSLVEALTRELLQPPPVATGQADDSWPMFGGDVSRSLIPSATGNPGARVYSIDLPGPNVEGLNEQAKRALLDSHNMAKSAGTAVNVMPVSDRGQLFFQDGYRVYAVQLESGVPLPGWAQTYGGSHAGQFWLPAGPNAFYNMVGLEQWQFSQMLVPEQRSLTLTDDAVLAVMGQAPLRFQLGTVSPAEGGARLVCLDRSTGRQRWTALPRSGTDDPGNAKNLTFSGSPLVVGDSVYVIARGSTAAGVEDCHVCCYGLAGGEYRWSSYVASSQSGNAAMNGVAMGPDADSLSHLAFGSGRVYVLTNLGAVAAIDAYSGATVWLTIYPRSEQAINALQQRQMRIMWGGINQMAASASSDALKPWELNPVILSGGCVFALPSDGTHIMVYSAGTGEEVKRVPREIEYGGRTTKLTMLLAVSGQKLIAAARDGILFLDWTKADPVEPNSRRLQAGAIETMTPFGGSIIGRPFVTSKQMYVPWETAISIIDLQSRKVVGRFPKGLAAWAPEEGPGNVLVTRDHVVVAAGKSVNVYTDLAAVRQKYLASIKSDPGNVEARLVFAELMFNANEIAEARQAMDEAILILGGLNSMRRGALRDRVFNDVMLFAQRAGSQKSVGSIALAEELFDQAAAAAQSPAQQVQYRLGRAGFIESMREMQKAPDWAKAVRLYQEILSSEEMRSIPLSAADGIELTAGQKAERGIAELIAKIGPAVYAPFEQKASSELAAMTNTQSATSLLALADEYPHASAAPQALLRAAAIHQNSGQPRLATIVLRRLHWQYQARLNDEERGRMAEALARSYLATGNVGAALGRLQRLGVASPGARLSGGLSVAGKPLKTKDDRPVQTLQEAVEALQVLYSQMAMESLPDVNLPPPLTMEERLAKKKLSSFEPAPESAVVGNVQSIVRAAMDVPNAARDDRLIVWSEGKLLCLPAGSATPIWTSAALTQPATVLAWLDKNVLLWNAEEAALLDGETGKPLWAWSVKSLPAAPEFVAAHHGGDAAAAAAQVDQRNVASRLQVNAVIVQQRALIPRALLGGRIAPAVERPMEPGGERMLHLRPLTDRLIISTSIGRVLAVDLGKGTLIWQARAARAMGIQQTLANEDFTVVRVVESPTAQLTVFDSYSGQRVWQTRAGQIQGTWLINAALSDDGMLVWTTQQSIAGKDLFDAGEAPTWERRGYSYAGMVHPEQLAIFGQEVFAVCNGGIVVTSTSLRKGEISRNPINMRTNDSSTRLRLAGPRLYVISGVSVIAYHLEHGTSVPIRLNPDVTSSSVECLLTKDYLVQPGVLNPGPFSPGRRTEASYTLQAFSRAMIRNNETGKLTESGLLVHRYDFVEPAKVKQWCAVQGGIYYLANDGKLHFLRGTRS